MANENIDYEINNEEIENEVLDVSCEEPEVSRGGGLIAKLLVGAGVATAGVLLFKNRHKIQEWNDKRKIAKLEKRGYVISKKPEPVIEGQIVDGEFEEVEE